MRKSGIVWLNDRKRTPTARDNSEILLSKNVTIDNLGKITIELGNYFSFPDNFEKLFNEGNSVLNLIFQISLNANPFHEMNYTIEMMSYTTSKIAGIKKSKTIGERSIKELLGSSFKNFKDSNRY